VSTDKVTAGPREPAGYPAPAGRDRRM